MRKILFVFASICVSALLSCLTTANGQSIAIWPDLAPGETTREVGEAMLGRPEEKPPVTRIVKITAPTMDVYLPKSNSSGVGMLILPGGGFSKVVPDLEGSEAAALLNQVGIAAFVLRYRTTEATTGDRWLRPLQDSQRAMRVIRSRAQEWKLNPAMLGLLGFSAGGQVAAIHLCDTHPQAYSRIDAIDDLSSRPEFAMLIYPWNVVDTKTNQLIPQIVVGKSHPPTFLVHTHDDRSSSVGSALIYAALRQLEIPAELHIYQTGGHGYGTRERPGSDIGTWPARAIDWLKQRGLAK